MYDNIIPEFAGVSPVRDQYISQTFMTEKKKTDLSPENILMNYTGLIKRSIRIFAVKYGVIKNEYLLEDIQQEVNARIINGCLNTFRGDTSIESYLSSGVVRSVFLDIINKEKKYFKDTEYIDDYSGETVKGHVKNDIIYPRNMVNEPDNDDDNEHKPMYEKPVYQHLLRRDHSGAITDRIVIEEIILREIQSMPQKRRDIYRMFIIEGKTQAEISKQLDISQSTVSEHWSKIQSQIRHAILKEIPELRHIIGAGHGKN